MKFWVYAVDWRSMAIEILAERPNVSLANAVAAGIAFFVKQLEIGGKVTTDINKFPEDLRIQEFPE